MAPKRTIPHTQSCWIMILGIACLLLSCHGEEIECGTIDVIRPRIQNGNEAVRGEWPFVVALFKANDVARYFCGGTIINNRHVLTAAHCIQQKYSRSKLSATDLFVRLGAHNLTDKFESDTVERNVSNIYVHPEWNPTTTKYDADIAILELSEEVVFTQFIRPICMPPSDFIYNVEASIVGWGIWNNGILAETPRHAVTNILNDSYCYTQDARIAAYSSLNTFCGGGGVGNPNRGDSGGGIFGIQYSAWVQYGIIAAVHTNSTGHVLPNSFAVYTSLNMFLDWIANTAKMNAVVNVTLTCRPGYFPGLCEVYDLDSLTTNTEVTSFKDLRLTASRDVDIVMVNIHSGYMLFLPNGLGKLFSKLEFLTIGDTHNRNMETLRTHSIKRTNFNDMEQLQFIIFARNHISDLAEDSLLDLPNLIWFTCNQNPLKILHEKTFAKNRNLKHISMLVNQIDFLPGELFKNNLLLEEVNFYSNSIQTIDAETFKFNEKLKKVDLAANQLKTLPANFFVNNLLLREINFSENSIGQINENIFGSNVQQMELTEFNFESNYLTKIEIDFTKFKSIDRIDFRSNGCINVEYKNQSTIENEYLTNNFTKFQTMVDATCD